MSDQRMNNSRDHYKAGRDLDASRGGKYALYVVMWCVLGMCVVMLVMILADRLRRVQVRPDAVDVEMVEPE